MYKVAIQGCKDGKSFFRQPSSGNGLDCEQIEAAGGQVRGDAQGSSGRQKGQEQAGTRQFWAGSGSHSWRALSGFCEQQGERGKVRREKRRIRAGAASLQPDEALKVFAFRFELLRIELCATNTASGRDRSQIDKSAGAGQGAREKSKEKRLTEAWGLILGKAKRHGIEMDKGHAVSAGDVNRALQVLQAWIGAA